MSETIWLPVVGAANYEVSNDGRVRSVDRVVSGRRVGGERALRTQRASGYQLLLIRMDDGHQRQRGVHQLVCEAFNGLHDGPNYQVRHLNGIPNDNRAENLAWGTPSQNQLDRVGHGRHDQAAKTHCHRQHEFTAENTRLARGPNGRMSRVCKSCQRLRQRNP